MSGYISQGYVHRPQLDWDVLDQVLRIRATTSKRIGIRMAVLRYLAELAGENILMQRFSMPIPSGVTFS